VAAAEDTAKLQDRAAALVNEGKDLDWYHEGGTAVDRAAFTLCRLRRARAGLRGGPEFGDEADPEAVVWLASRAVSYMDETGFPEAVELWFQEDLSD
jgi:hypothetical protein